MRLLRFAVLAVIIVLMSACGGGSVSPDKLTPGPPTTDLHLIAKGLKFDTKVLSAPADTEVSLTFSNQDSGVLHNVAIYTDKSARVKVFGTEVSSGKKTESYTFRTPAAGRYYFRCDVHPDMNGWLFVQ